MRTPLLLIFILISGSAFSQLGFCPGSKGDPIFHETFGTGIGTGAPLPAGVTTYTYVTGDPNDGQYTISSRIGQNNGSWHSAFPQTTLSNGKALVVNANENTAGMFYETEISGLCEATTYEFSAFLINVYDAASVDVCPGTGIPINVRFEIWDETDSSLLANGSTGDIDGTSSPKWEQYALVFRSQAGQSNVILRMFNNGIGGCGNDLAIDDIIFRSCGDLTEITSDVTGGNSMEVCEPEAPVTVDLTASPDGSVYNSYAFQWQESTDEENWQDIPGETGSSFSSPSVNSTRYYRVKVAEDAVNLADNLCSSASEAFAVIVVEDPEAPISEGDVEVCEGDNIPPLAVSVEDDESVFWFESASGGETIGTGRSFFPATEGTYYAEAAKTGFSCDPGPRTPVKLRIFSKPMVNDEVRRLCTGSEIQLDAGGGNFSYRWNTGMTTRQIAINQPGNYSVTLTNANGCSATKRFEVEPVDVAGIGNITSEGSTVIIEPSNSGQFEYSLDGSNFQRSNIFQNVSGGIYTAYVRDLEGCNTVSEEFPHIVLPKFITPNGDGMNDRFELKGVEYFSSSEIRIFDRYGKLVAMGEGAGFSWNGTFNGRDLPAEDYWYHISIEGFEPQTGHFTLKR
ncbi:T9SS type B sorting domain-containing protein [Salinimicrobium sp. HB62]|uniref:T9SS type B sorting domain-containing protein n=1 Tax=Salinimicrobium sp. HB62 TaxID=3077781 RepID=UPI002D77332A|nr:T9SS type B sorting domain-containing protein [Salinimicrobium sp. HB62]